MRTAWYFVLPLLAGIAVAIGIKSCSTSPPPAPAQQWSQAAPIKEVRNVAKVEVPVATKVVRAIPRQTAVATLRLPPMELGGLRPTEEVVAAVVAGPKDAPVQTVTVLDTDTGEARSITREGPAPLVSFEQRGEIALDYGIKATASLTQVAPQFRLSGSYEFAQVKGVGLRAVGTLYQDGDAFIGVGVRIPF